MGSGDNWWPMNENSYIKYRMYEITGVFNKLTLKLFVTLRVLKMERTLTVENKSCVCGNNFYGHRYSWDGKINGGIIYEGWDTIDGQRYLGEKINHLNGKYNPCLPKLAEIKSVTSVLTGSSITNCECAKIENNNPWKFKMIEKVNWGPFGECWRTGLWECNFNAYNYVFKEGIGMVDFWFIDPKTGSGYEYWAIEY